MAKSLCYLSGMDRNDTYVEIRHEKTRKKGEKGVN